MASKTVEIEGIPTGFAFLPHSAGTIFVTGSIFPNGGDHACTLMRLKKEVVQRNPQLNNINGSPAYLIALCDTYEEIRKQLEILEKTKAKVPMLFMIGEATDNKKGQ